MYDILYHNKHCMCLVVGINSEFYESPTTNENTFKFCEAPKYTKQKNAGRSKSSRKFDHANSSHEDIDLKESVPHVHQHNDKRHSILTESTFSESEVSGATTTTARCDSITGTNSSEKTNDVDPNFRSRVRNRRHAINITSNPSYQVGYNKKKPFPTHIKINIKIQNNIMSLILVLIRKFIERKIRIPVYTFTQSNIIHHAIQYSETTNSVLK